MCVTNFRGSYCSFTLGVSESTPEKSGKMERDERSSQILEGIKLCKANNLGDG